MTTIQRQKLILEKIIEEYIKSAKPVSSQLLEKKYNFRLSPATIRNEMQKLTTDGFLYQPHTSAGRVPTDKGYRFFVDKLFEKEINKFENDFKTREWLEEEMKDYLKFIQKITKTLANVSSGLAISYLFADKILWKEGWEELLKEPEFQVRGCILNFGKLLKKFEEDIEDLRLNSEIKVYIGKENPFSKSRDFSIIISQCKFPEKEEGIISLLGPKRMAYDKNIALINSLKKTLEKI